MAISLGSLRTVVIVSSVRDAVNFMGGRWSEVLYNQNSAAGFGLLR